MVNAARSALRVKRVYDLRSMDDPFGLGITGNAALGADRSRGVTTARAHLNTLAPLAYPFTIRLRLVIGRSFGIGDISVARSRSAPLRNGRQTSICENIPPSWLALANQPCDLRRLPLHRFCHAQPENLDGKAVLLHVDRISDHLKGELRMIGSLLDHRALEFSEDAAHLKQSLAGGRGRINTLLVQVRSMRLLWISSRKLTRFCKLRPQAID